MTLGAASIAESAIAADAESSSASAASIGVIPPLAGFGVQGTVVFRGQVFRATESPRLFRAKDEEVLGIVDIDPSERVWLECDAIDILHGASISECVIGTPHTIYAQELVSNGETVHKVKVLIGGGILEGATTVVNFIMTATDGSYRIRRLWVRGRAQ